MSSQNPKKLNSFHNFPSFAFFSIMSETPSQRPDSLGLGSDSVSISGSASTMADRDSAKNLIFYCRKRKKTFSRENDGNLNPRNDAASDSDSEKKSSEKKARVFYSVGEKMIGFEEVGVRNEGIENQKMRFEELGKVGSSSGCGSSIERGEAVDDAKANGKKKLDLDLNFPALELGEEGGSERGFQDDPRLGARVAKKIIEVISIDSDESENEVDQLVQERDKGGGDEEIERRFGYASKGSFDLDLERMGLVPMANGNGARRHSREEKGKGKLVDSWLSIATEPVELDMEPEREDLLEAAVSGLVKLREITREMEEAEELEIRRVQAVLSARKLASRRREDTRRYYDIARARALDLAHFDPKQGEHNQKSFQHERKVPSIEADKELGYLPGPFSTAMKTIKERSSRLQTMQNSLRISLNALQNSLPGVGGSAELIEWMPSNDRGRNISMPLIPSLLDLSMDVLAKNAEAIVSLEPAPDVLKHKLAQLLCDSRKMNGRFMDLLVRGSPTEIRVKDCSWMTEDQFTKTFGSSDTKNLRVLQLDLCGRCMSDYILRDTLARFSNSLPTLVTISLRGACRLSDNGLTALVVSAPALQSINLGQCSLLTATCINILADSLGSILKELYIDDCQNIDAMLILPGLRKFKHLEVLSVARIQNVCDDFVNDIIAEHGPNMKELVLADCVKLTDFSLKVIGNSCSRLCSLNISNLDKLTDLAIQYIANGCRSIQTLKLCRNGFSDEAIAAFLETSGESLKELSLNNIVKVGPNTAFSLAKCSRKLLSLDLSWCRNLTDDALGLIVDSCLSLRLLKLFGCTQISNVFLKGHSNSLVRIIGVKMTPVLEHLNMLEPQEAPLRYSALTFFTDPQSLDLPDV